MRQRRIVTLCALAGLASIVSVSCSGKTIPAGGTMLAFSSDMSIPKDVDQLDVIITQNGVTLFQQAYPIGPIPAQTLPSTLMVTPPPQNENDPVQVRVVGLRSGSAEVLRDAIFVVPTDRVTELRMPVDWLCVGSAQNGPTDTNGNPTYLATTCGNANAAGPQTCAAGGCVSAAIDSASLHTYNPPDIFGGGDPDGGEASCFDTLACFANATLATVDLATCTIPTPSGSGAGLGPNVAIVVGAHGDGICGDEACLIPLDGNSSEGWQTTSARIQLPPAVCQKLGTEAEAIVTTTTCPTKTSSLPPCGPWSSTGTGAADAGQNITLDAAVDATLDAGAASTPAPSCQADGQGLTDCPNAADGGTESCCTALPVAGGNFDRSYDGVSGGDMSAAYGASVSDFQLDAYEVTVGRFRQFVTAVEGGWQPVSGSGKHSYLNGGNGLAAAGGGGTFESGWNPTWNTYLATTANGWNASLASCGAGSTWTSSSGASDGEPINCVTWEEAYGFCIWDGAFLPSEAEWNYAAAGGGGTTGQRVYPWSSPSSAQTIDCQHASYAGCDAASPKTVGSYPAGSGAYGQSDLAGNVAEWTLDWYASYASPCTDCTQLTSSAERVVRGGSFLDDATALLASARQSVGAPPPPPKIRRPLPRGLRLGADGRYREPLCASGAFHCMGSRVMPAGYQPFGGILPDSGPTGMAPSDVLTAYNIPAAAQANGAIVAVLDFPDSTAFSDLTAYRAQYGLPALPQCSGTPTGTSPPCFAQVSETGTPSTGGDTGPGPDGETALDIEMVSAVCPDCSILVVEFDVTDASALDSQHILAAAATATSLGAVATSISIGGTEGGDPATAYTTPGHLVLAAAGDSAYENENLTGNPTSPSYPASSSTVLAVGGTTLITNGASGYDEGVWSDGTQVTTSGCSTEFTMPSWQATALSGTGCSRRATADLAAPAAFTSAGTPVSVAAYSGGVWQQVEGTSVSSPLVAGILTRLGLAVTVSNNLGWVYTNAGAFNDFGSTAYPSRGSTTNASDPSSCGKLCTVGPGWDGPSGVGTPNGALLSELADGGVLFDAGAGSGSDSGTPPAKDAGPSSSDDAGTASGTDDAGTAASGARSVRYGIRCARPPVTAP